VKRAKELAQEAVARFALDRKLNPFELAEYAVNLALAEACKAMCERCRANLPVSDGLHSWNHVTTNPHVRCDAAAIRAMMEDK
jgi:hypothetical protein